MSALDPVILSKLDNLLGQSQGSSHPPIGFGSFLPEKGVKISVGGCEYLRSGVLGKLGFQSNFPDSLAFVVPEGNGSPIFGQTSFYSCACSNDTIVLTASSGSKIFVARRAKGFVLEELDSPGAGSFRVRYAGGMFFFFGSSSTVYYSSDDMNTFKSVSSAVSSPKAVRFLSETQLVFLSIGSSSASSVSLHAVNGGDIQPGTSITLSGVTYLVDLAYVRNGIAAYFIAFRGNFGPAKATSLGGPYTSITTDPPSLGGVTINNSTAALLPAATQYAGQASLVRDGLCYFVLPGAGFASLDPVTNKVNLIIPAATVSNEAKIFDLSSHFGVTLSVTDAFRFYSPAVASLGSLSLSGNAELGLSEKVAIRLPNTSGGVPAVTTNYVKFAGIADYTKNLYLRIS
ncbi:MULTISPECIES: hypothetical protein [unclassified Aeromonas]|uniref:hypothetical protein n=1 Tax=unclassified Aeromonas TaxID=257493 RepID=UPI001112C8DD|nr:MULTISPECIES: hypothetical protein [unclassified Aeromonas]